ncbi:putative Zn(II)2Cys6 transcription factor [Aspergillus sclerotiicarbonarius CBS 121057]|uniref:Putative Zn(II)2Cys6 transcription factor n=1 Tax=Aspergillus sclerotiicarbonarius (strain CBS 121057 / IBT 28362) TaxID=1448318 RepID=A0A319ECN1_ASPSB|nr:putative Zn(II)2Cys6 transcription factor [Aspergillus sclerotiicarbonarius CBS 121057]
MSARRYRSTVACHSCRQRKVRCSLNVTGVPCIRCAQDHADCVVDARNETVRNHRRHVPTRQRSTPSHSPSNRVGRPSLHRGSTESPVVTGSRNSEAGERFTIQDEERNGLEIAEAALGNPERAGQVPFYTGDKTGITSTLTLCIPGESLPRHLLIPSHAPTSLSEEDRAYLTSKGVFNLPGEEACNSLLQAYFRHVHPVMPVIEVDHILHFFHTGRLREYNLLLVWSVLFVAVNFVPYNICELEGYESRKAMKAAMYSRAKCMYDNGGERNKIVLLQASLLLGFWHSEVDEHGQPWYWTGLSVTLCQILGLHRDPDATRYNPSISDRQRHLWRRLWWTCFFRDRWLSLTLGRPLRIDLDDCDVPMPSVADMLSDLSDVPEPIFSTFIPHDPPLLAEYWVRLMEMSRLLGAVLTMNYKTIRPKPSMSQVEALEADILRCRPPDRHDTGLSRPARAILIVFYRPFATETPDDLPPARQKQWQQTIRHKADSAASRTNDMLDVLAEENLLEYALPMTPPLLIPAMQIHLLNCRSGSPLARRLRLSKLNVCMMVMEEFQKVYTVASIYRVIFAKGIQQICPEEAAETMSASASVAVPAAAPAPAQPNVVVPPVSHELELGTEMDGMVDALLDGSSALNFWETWGQLWE